MSSPDATRTGSMARALLAVCVAMLLLAGCQRPLPAVVGAPHDAGNSSDTRASDDEPGDVPTTDGEPDDRNSPLDDLAPPPANPRPLLHFSATEGWLNDPNGLVFVDGTFQLFFQYAAKGPLASPLSWGHATSLDLLAFAARMSDRRIVATVDARRGEVFAATYRRVHGGVQRLTEPVVASPDEVAGLVAAVRAWVDGGVDPGDIGVAARTKTILGAAEKELRSAGIQARQLEDGKEEGAVALGTMHRMKGMEFRAVAVVDAGADRLPLPVAVTQASVDQLQHDHDLQRERCLVYVACTRARDTLRVSWTGKASPLLLVT